MTLIFLPELYITITFFLSEIIILRLHNINQDTIVCVVCEFHTFPSLISDGTGKVKQYPDS